jgi:cytochrome c-type biogenesis protein CcmH/NrfF
MDPMAVLDSAKSFYTDCFTWLLWVIGTAFIALGIVFPVCLQKYQEGVQRKTLAAEADKLREALRKELRATLAQELTERLADEAKTHRAEVSKQLATFGADTKKVLVLQTSAFLTFITTSPTSSASSILHFNCLLQSIQVNLILRDFAKVNEMVRTLEDWMATVSDTEKSKIKKDSICTGILASTIKDLAAENKDGIFTNQMMVLQTLQ